MSVTRVIRGSRQTRSRTGMPPLPAPTWIRCAIGILRTIARARNGKPRSFRLGKRPFAGFVPDFVARQPAPRSLDRERTGETRRVPAAGHACAPLAPQTKGLAL